VRIIFITVFSLLITSGSSFAQNFYKCQDQNGEWHFSEILETMPPYCVEKLRKERLQKEEEKRKQIEAEKAAAERRRKEPPKFGTKQSGSASASGSGVAPDCSELHDKLKDCQRFQCVFTDPKGKKVVRSIQGMSGTECAYQEKLTETRSLFCRFNSAELRNASLYYRLVGKAKKVESKVITDKYGKKTTVDVIDGKQLENPISAGISSGACEIQFQQ